MLKTERAKDLAKSKETCLKWFTLYFKIFDLFFFLLAAGSTILGTAADDRYRWGLSPWWSARAKSHLQGRDSSLYKDLTTTEELTEEDRGFSSATWLTGWRNPPLTNRRSDVAVDLTTGLPFHCNNFLGSRQLRRIKPGSSVSSIPESEALTTTPSTDGYWSGLTALIWRPQFEVCNRILPLRSLNNLIKIDHKCSIDTS